MGQQNGKMTPESMHDMCINTSFTEEELESWYSEFNKECPHGKLNAQKFQKMYSKFFPFGDARKFAEHVFRTFDADGNGDIDFREFMCSLSVMSRGSAEEKLKWAFHMYDVNGDGYVSRDEMLEIVKSVYKMLGEIGRVNLPEDERSPEQRTDKLFRKMDKNHDGKVSMKEFVEGAKRDKTMLHLLRVQAHFDGM